MAAHKIWSARGLTATSVDFLELSEFHLYAGGTRVDAAATLTANTAPTSGSLAVLKDDNLATGCYWSTGGQDVILTWEFEVAQAVTHIVLGARTTAVRFPRSLVLVGFALGSDEALRPKTFLSFGNLDFVSATKSALLAPSPAIAQAQVWQKSLLDHYAHATHGGRIPYTIERQVMPVTVPPTYTPQWAKVRLERDIDGAVVAEQWSDPVTGKGAFENIDEHFLYTLTAIYPNSGMRAVIADRIKPEGYPEPIP